jgi:tRNA(Ile)-lysidine synthase
MVPDAALVGRFRADLDALIDPGTRLGLAVSGGPDSVAMLLLAVAARPSITA